MCLGMVIGIARGTAESKPPVHCIRHPLPPAVRRRVGDRRYLRKETLPDGTIFAKTPDAECRVNDQLALHSTASAQTADAPSPGCVRANKAIHPPLANSGGPYSDGPDRGDVPPVTIPAPETQTYRSKVLPDRTPYPSENASSGPAPQLTHHRGRPGNNIRAP